VELVETPLEEVVSYRGKFLTLRRDKVRLPDGQQAEREYLLHPGAVAVLALTEDRQLVMERQYRYPIGQEFIEIPAGKIDQDESPVVTGERELYEETGYQAARWTFLGTAHPCIGYSNEVIHYFLAEELSLAERQLDDGEFLEVLTLPLAQVLTMSLDGRITDSKTIVGLHWLTAYLSGSLKGELLLPAA
jgi:ADP-ribose pyrophosphatase